MPAAAPLTEAEQAAIFARAYQFDNAFLEAENNYLLQRLAINRAARPTVMNRRGWHGAGARALTCEFATRVPTPLPMNGLPGREISLPVWLTAPGNVGTGELRVELVHADGGVFTAPERFSMAVGEKVTQPDRAPDPIRGPLADNGDADTIASVSA